MIRIPLIMICYTKTVMKFNIVLLHIDVFVFSYSSSVILCVMVFMEAKNTLLKYLSFNTLCNTVFFFRYS